MTGENTAETETNPGEQAAAGKVPATGTKAEAGKQTPPEKPAERRPEEKSWDISSYVVPPAEGKNRFHDFEIRHEVMHAISDLGFKYCTPIQAGILPKALEGLDAAGRAQTGTGKTAAFLIAIITRLLDNPVKERTRKSPRALILAPTRELAMQIKKMPMRSSNIPT